MAKKTRTQRQLADIRGRMRRFMESLAQSHRGCDTPRGCACVIDRALTVLEKAETDLFQIGIDDLCNPVKPRRIVRPDNSISDGSDV